MPLAAIAGVGLTTQTRSFDGSSMEACLQAASIALTDAGMEISEIDGIAARWPGPGGTVFQPGSTDWTAVFNRPFSWVYDTYPQGIPAVLDAGAAISAGLCKNVLIFGGQAGLTNNGSVASYTRPENEFVACWGSMTAAQFALTAQVYLHRFKPNREKLANLAATIRNAGSANPEAVMAGRGPYTPEDILTSPPIAEPIRLLDLCLANEGAAAIIVTSTERARDCPNSPIYVLGGGAEWYRQQYVNPPRFDEVWSLGTNSYHRTLATTDVKPSDIDLFEIYDINTFEIVRQFELLKLCEIGEGVDYLDDAGIGLEGKHPTNTDGGLLSFSHIGWGAPTLKIVEATLQLRGIARSGQVKGAETAFVTGAGSGAQYHNSILLGKNE